MRGSGGSDGCETDSDSALRERHGLEGRLAQMEQKLIEGGHGQIPRQAFELVPAPNASAAWVKALVEIAGERLVRADRGL